MGKNRLEAFSDGVLAIIITIMVLQMDIPHGNSIKDLLTLIPKFLSYVLSYIYVGIYWNNHHHMMHTVSRVSGSILWANMHLLFWLSLFPFSTGWMGQNNFAPWPTTLYGIVLVMAAIAYHILQDIIIKTEGEQSKLKQAVGKDLKGKASVVLYLAGVILAPIWTWIALIIYAVLAFVWLIPDRRIERILYSQGHKTD
ncbi:TMEM175 family protein [Candidatus Clostridium radicumherbarum]|uniref:TMEM175 family protein n=1 Tax=Candidatus Clostridium radicumherbarum TaxID=3381662 RepID=A0ABW8TQI9_9CLOT